MRFYAKCISRSTDFPHRGTGLIIGSLELSADGKAMKYYEVTDFDLHLTASALAGAVSTLSTPGPERGPTRKERP